MIRRSLGAALWTLVGLLAGFLGALSSLVGTGAGRTLLARVSEGALRQVFTGTVTLRLQAKRPAPGDSSLEIANDDRNGRLRVRRFAHLDARLGALQVSSPRERGIRIEVSRLAVEGSDPVVRLADVAGRLGIIGDSVNVQLARVRLPRSALRDARGTVRGPPHRIQRG